MTSNESPDSTPPLSPRPANNPPEQKDLPHSTPGSINITGTTVNTADVIIGNKNTTTTSPAAETSERKNPIQNTPAARPKSASADPKSSWANGLFYLFVFVVVVALVGFFASQFSLATLIVVILAGMIAVLLVGVLQLKVMNNITDKSFIELIGLVVKQLPLIRGLK
jgi:hypothetical protein